MSQVGITPSQSFQAAAPFNFQFNTPTTIKEENSILIQNLDQFITESMLHSKFSEVGEIKQISLKSHKISGRSMGRAVIEFRNESSVKDAIRRFNMRKFFEDNQAQEQKFMEVIPKVGKQKLDEFKSQCRLFFKVTSETEQQINPTEISDYLTVFGDIQQLKFKSKKGKLLNYGQIIFKNQEGKEKALQSNQKESSSQTGISLVFIEFDSRHDNYNLHVVEHDLINKDILQDILSDANKKEAERKKLQEIIEKELKSQSIDYQSVCLMINEQHKRPFFFVSVNSKEALEKIEENLKSHGAISTVISNKRNQEDQYKNLHLKNLKIQDFNEEQKKSIIDQFKNDFPNENKDEKVIIQEEQNRIQLAKIKRDLEILGFKDATLKLTVPPTINRQIISENTKNFQETRQGTIFFPTAELGIKFMTTYLTKPTIDTVKTWFLNDNPQGRVNILLNESDLDAYKKSKIRGSNEQYQLYQKAINQQLIQQQMAGNAQFQQNLQSNDPNISRQNYGSVNQNRSQTQGQQQQPFPNQSNHQSYTQNTGRNQSTPLNSQQRVYNQSQNNNYPRFNQGQRAFYNQNQGNYQGQRQPQAGGFQNGRSAQPQGQKYNYPQNQGQGQQIPQSNTQQFQGQQYSQQQQSQKVQTNQIQPKITTGTPQQINQSAIQQQQPPIQQQMTIDQISENPDEFVKKPQDLQKSILGQLIYPKVKAKLDERKEDSKTLTPKITGMLIDFTVFELEDIIEMIQNQEDLNERIEEALELIKNTPAQK